MMNAHLYGDLLAASFGPAGFLLYDARDAHGGLAVLSGARLPTIVRIETNPNPRQSTASLASAGAAFESRVMTLAIAAGLMNDPVTSTAGGGLRKIAGGGFFGRRPAGGEPSAASPAPGTPPIRLDAPFRAEAQPRIVRLSVEETLDLLVEGGRELIARMETMASRAPAQFRPAEWLEGVGLAAMTRPLQKFDRQRARNALRACPDAGIDAWLWCGAPPSREDVARAGADADTERLSLDRIQATSAQPLLAGVIASDPVLSAAVDARRSLVGEITKRFELTPASVKRLGKVTAPGDRLPEAGASGGQLRGEDALGINRIRIRFSGGAITMLDCLDVLKDLPPDWTPSTNEEWGSFTRVMSAAIPLVNLYALTPMEAFGTAKGKWGDYEKTLRKAAGYEVDQSDPAQARRALSLAFADAMECVHVMSVDTLLTPAVRKGLNAGFQAPPSAYFVEAAHRKALELMLGASGVVGLLEASRRWVGQMTRLVGQGAEAAPALIVGEPGTPEAFAPFLASNGYVVRHLVRDERIALETTRLGHCVGRPDMHYRRDNMQSRLHILSITTANDDASLSTVEIDPLTPNAALVVRQHQGPVSKGRAVSKEAQAAWSEFATALRRGDIVVPREQIGEAQAAWVDWNRRRAALAVESPVVRGWKNYLGSQVTKSLEAGAADDVLFFQAWGAIAKRRPEEVARAADAFGSIICPATVSEQIAAFGQQEMRL